MSDQVIGVRSEFPLFWQAVYPTNLTELRIPKCRSCGRLFKVSDYSRVTCPDPGCDGDITWDVDEGARRVPLVGGVLSEFDAEGESPLNFTLLPTDGLEYFGLVDVVTEQYYTLNMKNGRFFLGSGRPPVYTQVGIGIVAPTVNGRNLVRVSDQLEHYGVGGDLIHFKHAESTLGGGSRITNIVVGYKCRIPGWDATVLINVDTATHVPYIATKVTPVTE